MALDFKKYQEERQQKTQALASAMTKSSTNTNSYDDPRFWKPTLDAETGVGGAIIRFLPVTDGQTLDYVDYSQYTWKWEVSGKKPQWFIAKSRYKLKDIDPTQDSSDPVYELRQRLFATGQESDKKLAGAIAPTKVFIANILVIKDPINPENNGKKFLYRYNSTINKLIETALKPIADPLTGEMPESVNVFDLLEGANLEIRIKKTNQGWDYENTKFAKSSAIVENQESYDKLMTGVYGLSEFIDISTFQSYEWMKNRLAKVIDAEYIGTGVQVIVDKGTTQQTQQIKEPEKAPESVQQSFSEPEQKVENDVPFDFDEKQSDDSDDMFADLMKTIK